MDVAAQLLMPYIQDESKTTNKADLGVPRQRQTAYVQMQQEGMSSWFQLPPSASHHRDRYPTHAFRQQRFIPEVMLKLSLRPWKHAEVLFSCLFTVGYEVQSPVCFSLGSDIWKERNTADRTACRAEDGDSGSLQITWPRPLTLRYHFLTTIKTNWII